MEMPYTTRTIVHLAFLTFIFSMKSLAMPTYDVVKLGAKPDGKTDSRPAFLSAWSSACGSSQPTCIYVPKGTFLLHQIQFQGPCKNSAVLFKIIGTIVAPDYNVMGSADSWIWFHEVNGISIEGGSLDGRGTSLWKCKASGKNCPVGATTLAFYGSSNINITGLISKDSERFHIAFVSCQNVKLLRTTVLASEDSPNTDGIHLQLSTYVSIVHSIIGTGDDCISIGPGNRNIWIEDVHCGPGHGVSIGSLGMASVEDGVNNVTVKTARFVNTQNGVRIKTWAKPCKSFVRDVIFQGAIMNNVQNPIIIDQQYCPGIPDCPHQSSGVNISHIRYIDIHGTSATEVAMKFDCSETKPCHKLMLGDIYLTYNKQPAKAWCSNASGKASGTVKPRSCLKEDSRKNRPK